MACNASKAQFLRIIAKRGYSASGCPRAVGQVADVQCTVLDNKVVVAAADSALPVSRVSIVFRAGSRFETYENLGASHMMRIAAGLSTKKSSGFAITRNLQQAGASLTVTSDREIVSYTVTATANELNACLRYLKDVIQPSFKPWEISDVVERVKTQVAAVPPQVRAIELLHKAAFRQGLGNSIYIPIFRIGSLSSETLQHFVSCNFTASRCAVVGIGIDQNTLSGFAQRLELNPGDSGEAKPEPASYYGGDARKDTPGFISHVAVSGQGGSLQNPKEALAFAVLQHAVGSGASTKRGNINGYFGKALGSVLNDTSFSYAALNACYADAGLFGFAISTDCRHIGKAVEALAQALKSGAISAEDVNRGKVQLKAAILESYATDCNLIDEMGVQAVINKQVQSADALLAAIDGITEKDVQDAAGKAGSSALSVGAVGNLSNVPYASDLC